MTFGQLKKLMLKRAHDTKLPVNLEFDKWPVYVEVDSGPVLPLTEDMVAYGFVGGASALVIDLSSR